MLRPDMCRRPDVTACPICLSGNAPPPNQMCTRPPTRAAVLSPTSAVWCRLPACMDADEDLPREPSIAARCHDLAVDAVVRAPPHSTAHAEIRHDAHAFPR